jgi:hypothetical protein
MQRTQPPEIEIGGDIQIGEGELKRDVAEVVILGPFPVSVNLLRQDSLFINPLSDLKLLLFHEVRTRNVLFNLWLA